MKHYTIAFDPIDTGDNRTPDELQPQIEEIYDKIRKGKPYIKKKLDKLIKRYPNVPSLWNYQTAWYEAAGDIERAKQVNDEILKRFPRYIFAITNKAVFESAAGNVEEAYLLLGNGDLDISTLYPERKTFHITEFVSYSKAAVHYLTAAGRFEEADAYIEKLRKEGSKSEFISELNAIKYNYRFKSMEGKMQAWSENATDANERIEPTVTQFEGLLIPQNEKYHYLYDDELWEMDTGILEKHLEEDRAGIVAELHYILQRATEVMVYHYEEDEWTPAVLHAAILLAYIDAQKGFEELLQLLRQPGDMVDLFLGDWDEDIFNAYFSHPYDGQLDGVKNFVLEPLVPVSHKNGLLESLQVMIKADAGYQAKITALLEELMLAFREQKNNPDLMDAEVLAFVVGAAIDIKALKLLPLIEELFAEGLVSIWVEGDFEEAKKSMLKDEPSRAIKTYPTATVHIKALNKTLQNINRGKSISKDDFEDHSVELPIARPSSGTTNYSGTSLNAPCPCGSGKKYKRCHGKT